MFSFKRYRALVIKELKDMKNKKNAIFLYLLSVLLCIVYKKIMLGKEDGMAPWQLLIMCVSMGLVMGTAYVSSMLIAEEKEKNTLRTLLLSGLKPIEFFLGKGTITLLLTTLSNIFMFLYLGIDFSAFPIYFLLTTIIAILLNFFGAVVGMLSPNQMATGVIALPLLAIFLFIPVFAEMDQSFEKVAEFIPVYSMNKILAGVFKGQGVFNLTQHSYELLVIACWMLIGLLAFIGVYKKVGLEK